MSIDAPASTPRLPARAQADARRFVPTLTDVVHLDAQNPVEVQLPGADGPAVVSEAGLGGPQHSADASVDQLVGRACATVLQGLDDHIRAVVNEAMQTQQLLLVQSLRSQLVPVVETLVRDAVASDAAQAARRNGDGCIQATD